MTKQVFLVTALTLGFLGSARADVISRYGDIDCFGLGGSCADGSGFTSDLGGVQFNDYRSAAEIASNSVTDNWEHQNPAASMTFSYALDGTPVSATFTTRIAGIANAGFGPDDVTFDGTLLGQIPRNNSSNSDEEVLTYTFSVPIGLLTGNDATSIAVTGVDAFIIDYGQLSVMTTNTPEPSTLGILFAGLVGLFAICCRKGKTQH
jgi:hypothetical protein